MNNRDRRNTILLGIVLLLMLAAVVAWFVMRPDSSPTKTKEQELILAKHAISYNDDGSLKLYDVKTGKELDSFDLKTLSDEKEIVVKESEIEQVEPEKTPVIEETKKESYKDFDIVWMTIEKGDNAWTIQSNLTPERNPSKMLGYVREINENYAMHPIYPGQKYAFLKEKGATTDKQYSDKLTEAPEAFIEDMEKEQVVVETEVVTKIEKEDSYIYYSSQKDEVLYAHSDFNKMIYKISVNKNKLKVEEKWRLKGEIGEPVRFILENEVAYFEYAASTKLNVLEMGKHLKTVNLEGVPSHRVVINDVYIYTFDDFIGNYNFKENEVKKAVLGDNTKDLIALKDKVYVINAFGQGLMKNVLFKVNPKDLYVDKLLEISSDESTFASYGDEEALWLSYIDKKKDLEGNLIEEELMTGIDTQKMKFNKTLWAFDLLTISYSAKNYIYDLSAPEKVDIYEVGNANSVHSFNYKGDNLFVILPN